MSRCDCGVEEHLVHVGRGEGRGAAAQWVPGPGLLEEPPRVLVNPGEAEPEGGQAAPGQAGAKEVFSSREEKKGGSLTPCPQCMEKRGCGTAKGGLMPLSWVLFQLTLEKPLCDITYDTSNRCRVSLSCPCSTAGAAATRLHMWHSRGRAPPLPVGKGQKSSEKWGSYWSVLVSWVHF